MDGKPSIAIITDPPGSLRLVLAGRLTVADAAQLHRIARDLSGRGTDLTICCAAVEYLDASAIQLVLALGRALTTRGRRCDVTGVTGPLANLFRLVGLG